MALYCEGNTDKHFLPKIVERTAEKIIFSYATNYMEILPVTVKDVAKQEHGKDILQAAMQAYGYMFSLCIKMLIFVLMKTLKHNALNLDASWYKEAVKMYVKSWCPLSPCVRLKHG